MRNVVSPWAAPKDSNDWPEEIRALYAESDQAMKIANQTVQDRKPLSNAEDIALIDDMLDALTDPKQSKLARPVLRHALKEIARAALVRKTATL